MQLTIDLRITGCQTRCWHCYVDGGPGPFMSFSEVVEIGSFQRKAIPILMEHFDSVDPYLDLEPVSHPDIVKIIQFFASQDIFPFNDFIPTTGVAFARRSDYGQVLDAFKKAGVKGFEFTLHGNRRVHNEAVNNRQALDLQWESLERIKQHGFLSQANVIVSKKLIECFDEVCQILAEHAFDAVRLTIPHFEPTERLRRFERHRAEVHDIAQIVAHDLFRTCTNSAFWSEYEGYTEKALLKKVIDFDGTWEEMANQFPQWVFITVVPGLEVYYGNGALLHHRIGNIRTTDFCGLMKSITRLKSNYCINGYYDTNLLPQPKTVIQDCGQRDSAKIYPSLDDVIMLCIDRHQMHRKDMGSQG